MQVAATLPLPLPLTLPLPLPLPLTLTLTLALTLALALALAPTRCKAQYTITKDRSSGKYACYGKFNPNERKWEEHANSPHDGATTIWQVRARVGVGVGVRVRVRVRVQVRVRVSHRTTEPPPSGRWTGLL